MSSAGMLLLFLAGPVAGPMPDGRAIGQADAPATCASEADPDAIVVCAQRKAPSPRLPMREDRMAAGEVVRHPGEPPPPDAGPPDEPSRLMETLGKAVADVRSLITGEDPGF